MSTAGVEWFPVATTNDLIAGGVYRTSLLGRELVMWRADDGFVNVWENRCLHRGVRLSIGSNDGAELVCRYHGWRYANRSAGCTYIPAHPADSPARTITNRTFPAVERFGLIWTGDDPAGAGPDIEGLSEDVLCLRSLPVHAPKSFVEAHLDNYRVDSDDGRVVFFVQPVDESRSVIRPVLADSTGDPLSLLRLHAAALGRLVRQVESEPFDAPESMPVVLETPVVLPFVAAVSGRTAPLDVRVANKWHTAQGIAALEFEAAAGADALPTFQPGSHIDVHLSNGLIRQYSLTNKPGDGSRYRIGVKRDPNSQGGSVALHDDVTIGDKLQISEPRNGFALRRNMPKTFLIAGGIGITPLLSMAHALDTMSLDFALHYFVGHAEEVAFRDEVEGFGDRCTLHIGLNAETTGERLATLLAHPDALAQVYACGPPRMLDALRATAADAGWPRDAVHFEYFENTTEIDDSKAFTVELARSALTLEVPSGQTILDVLRKNDVPIVSSCEQGACGTCSATVIEGTPLHQDVYLNPAEREAGLTMLTCVSRAASDRLVLDL